jgi:hypothetical protein
MCRNNIFIKFWRSVGTQCQYAFSNLLKEKPFIIENYALKFSLERGKII